MQRQIEIHLLLDDGHQHIGGHGHPYLALDGVLGSAEEPLDAQVLLDPLEEQLHLPAAFVQSADTQGGDAEVIGQEHQRLSGFRVLVADAPQSLWIALLRVEHRQFDLLVADQSRLAIHRAGVDALALEVRLGPCDEEAASLVQGIQPLEVEIAPVHHIEGARLGQQDVEHIDVVQLAIRDENERWNGATQVQQRVQLDRRLGIAKRRPWKQRQAQIDGGGIQSIDRVVQIDGQGVLGVQAPRDPNQRLGKLAMDTPIPCLVGVGQVAATDVAPNPQVIELGQLRSQTRLDVPQALPVGKLREGHAQKLVEAAEGADVEVATVLRNQPAKGMPRRELPHMSKYELA